jgi:hypothetical protein
MAKRSIKAGTTSQREYVFVNDSASTTGAGKTGIAYNAAGIKAYYVRPGGSATAITLATQTVTGAFSSGGWVEVDSTNMPGVYRFDVPDAVFAAGAEKAIVMISGASGMAPVVMEYDLTAYDPYDTVRLGLTAIPNVASGSAGAIITSGTGTAQLSVSSGAVTVGTNSDKTGYSLSSIQTFNTTGSVGSVTGDVGGNVVGSVASVTNRVTANTDQWNGVSVTGMPLPTASYTAPLDAAGTRAAVGLASANLDTQLATLPTAGENADAVWDEAYSGHTTAGSFGKLMDTLRKANYVTEGAVAAGGTPTTTVFRTTLTEPTGTFDNQTLLFISGDLAGESAPIEAYSVTNGQITLGDALTQAPTAADEFVILPDHVHPIGEIADGVLTRQMTEAYRAAGVAPTLAQVAFELIAHMGDSSISGTTKTLKKIDGTTAKTFTLDSATTPTSITEAT